MKKQVSPSVSAHLLRSALILLSLLGIYAMSFALGQRNTAKSTVRPADSSAGSDAPFRKPRTAVLPQRPAVCTLDGTLGTAPPGGDTGSIATRIFQPGSPTVMCGVPPVWPGNTGTGPFIYNVHYITNSSASPLCTAVAPLLLTGGLPTTDIQCSAFMAPFAAGDITNQARYLGDAGRSTGPFPFDTSPFFQLTIPAGATIALVVFNVNVFPAGQGATYQLLLDQDIFCQQGAPTPTGTPSPGATTPPICAIPTPGVCTPYEAELTQNTLEGSAIVLDCPTCSNGAKVSYVGNNSGSLQFNGVGAIAPGNYTMTICYLNGDAVRYAYLSVNGGPGTSVSFPSTGSFHTVGSIQVTVTLNTGCNTLKFYNPIVGSWAPDFDSIRFNCPNCGGPSPTPTATPIASATPGSPTPTPTPTPDGCYPNFMTAEGCDALLSLTTGSGNTALGWRALFVDTTGNFNTGVGGGALALNTMDSNTAVGAAALLLNSTGTENTAVGTNALLFNGSGDVSGDGNTATGYAALMNNLTGGSNTANGWEALTANVEAANNVALGNHSLSSNHSGFNNTTVGSLTLDNSIAPKRHVIVGTGAGSGITIVDDNIIIGHHSGVHSRFGQEDNVCYIGNIYGSNVDDAGGVARMVFVDPDGRLGTVPCPVEGCPGESSPKGIQPQAIPDGVNQAMVNLEVQSLEASISQQQNQIEILTAQIKEQIVQIQEVNAQIEMRKSAAKMIVNKPKTVP